MNPQTPDQWQDLAAIWKTGGAAIAAADIERLHGRQQRRLRIARVAEMASSILGVVAAAWLILLSRFMWVGIVTAAFSGAAVYFVLRARRLPVPQGSSDLLQSLKESLTYLDWMAEQLRYGRMLGFMALFAVVMAASTQLMRFAGATPAVLLATATAVIAIGTALAWNMSLACQVWRRTRHLQAFRVKLVTERTESPAP